MCKTVTNMTLLLPLTQCWGQLQSKAMYLADVRPAGATSVKITSPTNSAKKHSASANSVQSASDSENPAKTESMKMKLQLLGANK